jgi:hypothetical protein
MERFDKAFSQIKMSDELAKPIGLAYYALALAHTGSPRAGDVAVVIKKKLRQEPPISAKSDAAAISWWLSAEVYSLMNNAEGAVRCLRESSEVKDIRQWLIYEKNKPK